jgi:HD-GYP domain-containing protein (c-di-GMP phosphodiesterase class II)
MLSERDPYTAEHSDGLVEMACAVARSLDVEPAELAELRLAAPLHDLGKIRVPSSVLLKPGPLNARERAVINHHPVWGAELLACVPVSRSSPASFASTTSAGTAAAIRTA